MMKAFARTDRDLSSVQAGEDDSCKPRRLEPGPSYSICILTDCYPPSIGGIEHYTYGLAARLGQLGHRVDVVTHEAALPSPAGDADDIVGESPSKIRVLRVPGLVFRSQGHDPSVDPRVVRRVARLVAANGYDIVHGQTLGSLLVLAGLWAAKRSGITTFLTKHSMTARPTRPVVVRRVLSRLERGIVRRWVDGVIGVSHGAAEELAATVSARYVIPPGVDCEHWRPNPEARKRIRADLGYEEEHVVIGIMARMVASKGWLSLPEIAAQVVARLPHARFLGIGDGPLREAFASDVARLGLGDRFTVIGFRPWRVVPDYLNAMDIFAFPSRVEAFGMVLLEAMACGKPCVSRITAGSRHIIAEQEIGCLVASDAEMTQALLSLAQDEMRQKNMGIAARRYVEERYSWRVIAERVVEAYEEALGRRQSQRDGDDKRSHGH